MAGKGKKSAAAKREQQRIMLEAENILSHSDHLQQFNQDLATSPKGKSDLLGNVKFFKNCDTGSDHQNNNSKSAPTTVTTN